MQPNNPVQPAPPVAQAGGQAAPQQVQPGQPQQAAAPVQQSSQPMPPVAQAVGQAVQPSQPQQTPPQAPPPPPKRKLPMKLIIGVAVVFIIIFVSIIAFTFLSTPPAEEQVDTTDLVFAPEATPAAGPDEHTNQEYPEFSGVEIGTNTVQFNKVNDSFQIKYKDVIYHEQDTGSFVPRVVTTQKFEAIDDFPWYGMVDAPKDLVDPDGAGDQLFSFKAPPTYRSFVFIMRWDRPSGEVYEMYRFHDDGITKLDEFTKTRTFYVPKLHEFSLGGNFISINIFSCPTCTDEEPEVLLYHIPSGETKSIGRVSYFAWGQDDNAYEYKEYRPGVDSDLLPILKNEFFVESVDILNS